MHHFACLLRGINVGKANRIAMTDLKALLEDLGYSQVRTLLASGNVVFASAEKNPAKQAQAIRAAIGAKLDLDLDAAVIVKSAALALLGKVGRAATTRNWSTVQKLQALLLAMQKA